VEANLDGSAVRERPRSIVPSLICPACGTALRMATDEWVGDVCAHQFPIRDGIAELAVTGGAETWGEAPAGPSSVRYQKNYREVAAAESYDRGYREKAWKRLSTARERRLLRRLLAASGHCDVLLNLPCGGGRLSDVLAESTDLLLEADIARGQLRYGAQQRDWATPEIRMTASAFHIPFRDRAVSGAVCVRLCHHLPTAAERRRLLAELLRVSERFVVMTFFDFRSLKNLLRRAQSRLADKAPKHTMRVEEIEAIAAANGFVLEACPALSLVGSGHRYALLRRHRAPA
jgi:SAM-dependent methyltransferase